MQYGSIPAGGLGSRLQPIGFSKELAPVGRRAVIEHLIERMVLAGIDKIFINTTEDKSDLIRYLATKSPYANNCIFLVRTRRGLLDGVVQPAQFLRADDELYFGLPDSIWFPKACYRSIVEHPGALVLGLFDTGTPHRFDSVVVDADGRIRSIEVKVPEPRSKWTWGIGKIRVAEIPVLLRFAEQQPGPDLPLFGEAMNAYAAAHPAFGVCFEGSSYLDIGRAEDYAEAEEFLRRRDPARGVDASRPGWSGH